MKKKDIQRIDISKIENPSFLKDCSYEQLNMLSSDIREYMIDSVSKNGGHLSSNLGVVEATIALCRSFDFSKDKIVFDVGHQCYTYKILTGRSLDNLRQSNGPSGFQKRVESSYDHFEAGHSSTSISVANGMSIARDLNGDKNKYDIVAFIGDSSIVNGLAFEGLNDAASYGHKIIIVLNDNDMSIGKPVGGLSKSLRKLSMSSFYRKSKSLYVRTMLKTKAGTKFYIWSAKVKNWFKRRLMNITIFDGLGYSVIGPVDGHNVKAMEKAFSKARKTDRSVVVHIKTIKGRGYSYAENDKKGVWHGVGKFNKETGVIETNDNLWSWSEIYKEGILKRMREDSNTIAIVPATGLGSSLSDVFEEFPGRTIDVGIAEEHAMTMSAGLASTGKHPIVSIYSTFLQRAYDQINHDLARMKFDATILIDRAGLVGNDGATHQGIFDESILMGIPNTVVAMAANPAQSLSLINESKNSHGVFCIRFPKDYCDSKAETPADVPFGAWITEREGGKTAIVSVGPETENLKKIISDNNIEVSLFNAVYQKPMDEACIERLLNYDKVIIYNAYATEAGFANSLCARLIQLGFKGKLIAKTAPTEFIEHATIKEQKQMFGLLPEDIIKLI